MDYFGISTVLSIPSERTVFSGLKMYVVESKGGAIACMLLALFFLGTWPAILTLLERRGRLPQHTYLDYTITNLLAAVIIAFTFGEIGKSTIEKPNFINQLSQDNWPSVLFAMAGGIVLSLGNLATQYAWAFVGLSVTEVITSSITVVIGTTLNYFLDDKINKAEILFPGVGCFLIAVCFGSAVHSSNAADNKAKLTNYSNDSKASAQGLKDASVSKETYANKAYLFIQEDLENGTATKEKAEFGTAHFLIELENKRAIKVFGKGTFIGLAITFFAGVCFSLFSPAFNLATNDQWHTLKDGVHHLSVYTAFFYFSVSCFVIAIILNISFLYRPVLNLPKSSFRAYLSDWNGRGWALLAGFLCGFGNGLQFMGGQAAGYAAADAVQALPLVSTFWGILLFGEYRRSSRRTYALLVGMLSMFIIAVGVLMASSGHRKLGIGILQGVLIFLNIPALISLPSEIIFLLWSQNSTVKKPNFVSQLAQENWPSVLFVITGGAVLSLGNLTTQYAWAFLGLLVTKVISASVTVKIVNVKLDLYRMKEVAASKKTDGETEDVEKVIGDKAAKFRTADYLIEPEKKRAIKALPLVSTIWGVILFGVFRRSSRRTYILLAGMLAMFIVAVGVLMASAGQRK
ncbi:UNVERIFIED_CONTAM: Ureide permease 1 [Sesamum calycinum]|uniref:Ureide permease 1 n=1 Tax=Sesamum calycinum TaxID=2727403 RepID=A0AAW2PR17_9LAMI